VRDSFLNLCQRKSNFTRCGNELELGQRLFIVFAIPIWQSARRCDEATALLEPQGVTRQAAARF
jgi:hypothetical protein